MKSGGFTLIEILVVVVIMAMVYSLVPPLFSSGVSSVEIKAAARKIATGLRKARNDAMVTKQERALVVNVDDRTFQLTGDARIYRLPPAANVNLFTAKEELAGSQSGAIRFYPDGGSTGGRITISGNNGPGYKVDVDWLTGRVAILN